MAAVSAIGPIAAFPTNAKRGVCFILKDILGMRWDIFLKNCPTLSIANQSVAYVKS